jgi:lysophospholipase L1-like esterase
LSLLTTIPALISEFAGGIPLESSPQKFHCECRMKFMSITFLLAFMTLLNPFSLVAADFPQPPIFRNLAEGKKQTVVVYGTSLTEGGAWAPAMKQWFDANYPGLVSFVNSGGPGQNSDWGLQNLKTKVLDYHPDLVFIEFSYNDAHEKFKMPVDKGASNLDQMVQTILKENPEVTIVLQTMNVGWDAPNANMSLSIRPQLEEFNNNYRAYASKHNLPLLDHYVTWLKLKETDPATYQRYIPDGTHPGKEGSLAVTWPTIKDWLQKASGKTDPVPKS